MALADNLVSYWKLDESSGNASDSVGSNTLTNTDVTYGAGKINNGGVFNGSTAKLVNTTDLGITGGNISISAWIKLGAEISSSLYTVAYQFDTGNEVGYKIVYNYYGGTRRLSFWRIRQSQAFTGPDYEVTLGTSNWYHLVLTYNGTNVIGYVNGSSIGSVSDSGNGSSSALPDQFSLGTVESGSEWFNGTIDEVGIWSRALTSTEVTSLYNSGNGIQYPFGTAYSLACEVGSFTLTGINIGIQKALKLSAEVGEFTLTGIDIGIKQAKSLVCEVGEFILTGWNIVAKYKGWKNKTKSTSTLNNKSKSSSSWTNKNKS